MLLIVLIGLALRFHWPEPVEETNVAQADELTRCARPHGPRICTGDASDSG